MYRNRVLLNLIIKEICRHVYNHQSCVSAVLFTAAMAAMAAMARRPSAASLSARILANVTSRSPSATRSLRGCSTHSCFSTFITTRHYITARHSKSRHYITLLHHTTRSHRITNFITSRQYITSRHITLILQQEAMPRAHRP